MTPAEAAVLLARISASDNREVSEASARAWADSLPDVALEDALAYLPDYYRAATRDSKNWIYPGDVLDGVIDMHQRRRSALAYDARQEILSRADDDEDDPGHMMAAQRAMIEAVRKYNAEHKIPVKTSTPRERREAAERNPFATIEGRYYDHAAGRAI